ncbi:hypothetical protein GGR50DRAFT_691033 [Xylaria sp. CBS 124048]|nr:hypothetical protein GGR50DRAFT_691033 [Xylaria sp. CBS 124048]
MATTNNNNNDAQKGGIGILRTNVKHTTPSTAQPWHTVSATSPTGCSFTIHATRPLPDPIFHKINSDPGAYVEIEHNPMGCTCTNHARSVACFFDAWRAVHLKLRHDPEDHASSPFYPDYEYAIGEALGHASLIISLSCGLPIPKVYEDLVPEYGTP